MNEELLEFCKNITVAPTTIEDEDEAKLYVFAAKRMIVGYERERNVKQGLDLIEAVLDRCEDFYEEEYYEHLSIWLSNFYRFGINVAVDKKKGLEILEKAFNKRDEFMFDLNNVATEIIKCYLHGDGVEKDEEKALDIYLESASLQYKILEKDPALMFELADLVGRTERVNDAFSRVFMQKINEPESDSMLSSLPFLDEEVERRREGKPYVDLKSGELVSD